MDLSIVVLVVVGLILVIGSMVGLTTLGKNRPGAVLIAIFAAFAVYISIILVQIGVLDLSWLFPGSE